MTNLPPLFRLRDLLLDSNYSAVTRAVAWGLVSHLSNETGDAWPSVSMLMRLTALSRRQVQRALTALCDGGLFSRRFASGGRTVYTFVGGGVSQTPVSDSHPCPTDTGDSQTPVSDRRGRGVSQTRGGRLTDAPNRRTINITTQELLQIPARLQRAAPALRAGGTRARETWLTPYAEAWNRRWGAESRPPYGELAKALSLPEAKALDPRDLAERWVRFLSAAKEAQFARPARFIESLGQWTLIETLKNSKGPTAGMMLYLEELKREREGTKNPPDGK